MISNAQIKKLASFRHQKQCESENCFIVEGDKMCQEALRSNFVIRTICALPKWIEQNTHLLPTDCSIFTVTTEQLERISNMQTPNQVWMLLGRPQQKRLSMEHPTILLALDGLQDPGNMGTILRTADWYGIRNIICSHDTVSCYNPKVVQASMGAIFRTDVIYDNIVNRLCSLREEGYTIYGTMLHGDNLYKTEKKAPAIIVIGNEGRGISPDVGHCLHKQITIPNYGGTCESLNAAVATAIIVSEFYR